MSQATTTPDLEPPGWDLEPDELRRLGRRLIEEVGEILAEDRHDPILPDASGDEVRRAFDEPPPREGIPPERWGSELLGESLAKVRRYNRRNGHPRFFGYVCSSADPVAVLADALASAMDQIPTAWRSAPAATEVERRVVTWLDELVGFDSRLDDEHGIASGQLTSGGSAANLHGLLCALVDAEPEPGERRDLVVYLSEEGHASMAKAARTLGIRPGNLRSIPVDDKWRMRPDALGDAIRADRDAGRIPACVGASAGTTNTGAIDPLDEIADVCEEHGVWLHVDGAYGAPAAMTERHAHLRRSFARADSLSLDPHKWLFAPFDAGCTLVRDRRAAARAFDISGAYLEEAETDPIEGYAFFHEGLELSRRFRALKVWWTLKARGADAVAREIDRHCRLREHLDARLEAEPRLERVGSGLSITAFRYLASEDEEENDKANRRILDAIVREGRIFMSPTVLRGRFCLRAAFLNFRTRVEDVDLLVDEVLRHGRS